MYEIPTYSTTPSSIQITVVCVFNSCIVKVLYPLPKKQKKKKQWIESPGQEKKRMETLTYWPSVLTQFLRLLDLNPSQCHKEPTINVTEQKAYMRCTFELGRKVLEKCGGTNIENQGRLFYCSIRGYMTCCFRYLQIL